MVLLMVIMQSITLNGVSSCQCSCMIQPGQAQGSVGLALGYGRTLGLKDEMQVGVNAYPLYKTQDNIQYGVSIEKVVEPINLLVHKYKKQLRVVMIF